MSMSLRNRMVPPDRCWAERGFFIGLGMILAVPLFPLVGIALVIGAFRFLRVVLTDEEMPGPLRELAWLGTILGAATLLLVGLEAIAPLRP